MQNDDQKIKELLKKSRTIAVVGLSPDPDKPSFEVASYLKEHGYKIIPVRPNTEEVLGEKAYGSLAEIPGSIDIVDVFRKSEFIPEIVDEAIRIKAKAVWMQLGLRHEEAAKKAEQAGLTVIQDRCMLVEHRRLLK